MTARHLTARTPYRHEYGSSCRSRFRGGLTGKLDEVELSLSGDFTTDDGSVGFYVSFAGDAAVLVLRQAGIQDRIRNRICDFVGMAFTAGLGRENVTVAHSFFVLFSVFKRTEE